MTFDELWKEVEQERNNLSPLGGEIRKAMIKRG